MKFCIPESDSSNIKIGLEKKKKTKKMKTDIEENGHANGIVSDVEMAEGATPSPPKKKKNKKGKSENGTDNETGEKTWEDAADFSNFKIHEQTLEKLKAKGIKYLFPVQYKTFDAIQRGDDVIAQARTGTGKTLAFALPLVEKLLTYEKKSEYGRCPKVLVLSPTRELAKQVQDDFVSISSKLQMLVIYGGVPYYSQEKILREGCDIVVGTPGRILDHVQRGNLRLNEIQHVVLDEVDQMLDMGFLPSVEEILAGAYNREGDVKQPQTLLFSATLPPWVSNTAKKYMKNAIFKIDLIGQETNKTATTVTHYAIMSSYQDRASAIGDMVQVYSGNHGRAMVFCETKRDCDELCSSPSIKVDCHVLHGDIPQVKREIVLKGFKEGKYKCLVTTNVAARGLDLPLVDLVIQISPPQDTDFYIHRSGRTGRAGRPGVSVCFYKRQEEQGIFWLERKAGIKFQRITRPSADDLVKAAAADSARSLDDVTDNTIEMFRESAENLIKQKGAVEALSAALAVISGSTKLASRSYLTCREGFTTYIFRSKVELRTNSYVWTAMKRVFGEQAEQMTNMAMLTDKKGCAFDIPEEMEEVVEEKWQDTLYDSLEKATEKPEVLERPAQNFGSNNGRGGYGASTGRGGYGASSGRGGGRFNNNRGGGGRGWGSGGGFRGRGQGASFRKRESPFDAPTQGKKMRFN